MHVNTIKTRPCQQNKVESCNPWSKSCVYRILVKILLVYLCKTRATPQHGPCKSRQICRGHPLHMQLLKKMHKKMFGLENEGQDHEVQHSKWYHWMANINVCKSHITHFCDSSYRFQDINISNLLPWKFKTNWTFTVAPFDGQYLTS